MNEITYELQAFIDGNLLICVPINETKYLTELRLVTGLAWISGQAIDSETTDKVFRSENLSEIYLECIVNSRKEYAIVYSAEKYLIETHDNRPRVYLSEIFKESENILIEENILMDMFKG